MKSVYFSLIFVSCILGGSASPVLFLDKPNSSFEVFPVTSPSCYTGYSQPENSGWDYCYKVYSNYKTKKAAASQCKKDGGALASVPNAFVNSYIYSLANNVDATSLWLGIECLNGDKTHCMNDDSTNFGFDNFYVAEPKAENSCVYMSTIGRDSQYWLSFDCEQKFQFVCEFYLGAVTSTSSSETPVQPTTQTPIQKSCPQNYTEVLGMCYGMFYDYPSLNRDQQSAQCKNILGGNLASIHSDQVNDILLTFAETKFVALRIGLRCQNVSYASDTSSCKWDDETPFDYSGFAGGNPQVYYASTNCVHLEFGYWYNKYDCGEDFSYYACQAPMDLN